MTIFKTALVTATLIFAFAIAAAAQENRLLSYLVLDEYANDLVYRVFGNAANVPDGTGTDPFAKFTNSTNADQFGVAAFAPGSPTGHHGGRWAVYTATWTTGDASTLVTSWSQLESLVSSGQVTLTRNAAADFRCPVLGDPQPVG